MYFLHQYLSLSLNYHIACAENEKNTPKFAHAVLCLCKEIAIQKRLRQRCNRVRIFVAYNG